MGRVTTQHLIETQPNTAQARTAKQPRMGGVAVAKRGKCRPSGGSDQSVRSGHADPRAIARAEMILRHEVVFIHNTDFEKPTAAAILDVSAQTAGSGRRAKRPPGLPAYLASLYEVPLLTAAEEVALFRKMNYLKYLAKRIRSQLDARYPDIALMDQFDALLTEEQTIRNRIARCNLRLVVSLARKFADRDNPFDDYVSDGNVALLSAVAKFDYGRGFRFSTYATHAIRRAFYRQVQQKRRRKDRMVLGTAELIGQDPRPLRATARGREAIR